MNFSFKSSKFWSIYQWDWEYEDSENELFISQSKISTQAVAEALDSLEVHYGPLNRGIP